MKDLIDHIRENCTPINREAWFDQMLDEAYDFSKVGGPFAHMVPSQVLKEVDPVAYRCGVNDYMDGEDTYEIDGETYDRREAEDAWDEFVDALEDELSVLEVEVELESVEVEDSGDRSLSEYEEERDRLQDQINTVEGRIKEAKSYQF